MTGKDEALRGPDMSPEEASAASEDANVGVRIPHYPVYSEVRHLLTVWPGRLRKQVIGLHSTLYEQRGTPQKTVDWTDPATWMPERLAGDDLDLAQAVWNQSNQAVNPRFTRRVICSLRCITVFSTSMQMGSLSSRKPAVISWSIPGVKPRRWSMKARAWPSCC